MAHRIVQKNKENQRRRTQLVSYHRQPVVQRNHPRKITKKFLKKAKALVRKILKNSPSLKQAAKNARKHAIAILQNPNATIKQKKQAILVFKKVKKIVQKMQNHLTNNALRVIPSRISPNDVGHTSHKILSSIKVLATHHKLSDLKDISQQISKNILRNSMNGEVAKRVVATMIKRVVNKRNVSYSVKAVLNKIAADVIKKVRRN